MPTMPSDPTPDPSPALPPPDDEREELLALVQEYLSCGGLFNPEFMEHEKVRDMVMRLRDFIDRRTRPSASAPGVERIEAAGVDFVAGDGEDDIPDMYYAEDDGLPIYGPHWTPAKLRAVAADMERRAMGALRPASEADDTNPQAQGGAGT